MKRAGPGRNMPMQETDVFVFNDQFIDPRPKVHINSIQAKVSVSVIGSFGDYGLNLV